MPTPSRRRSASAKTDPDPLPSEEAGLEARPEADNLVGIYAALADITKAEVLKQFGGAQFSTFKPALADLLGREALADRRRDEAPHQGRPAYIDRVLADGSERAHAIAAETMNAVKDIVGFIRH